MALNQSFAPICSQLPRRRAHRTNACKSARSMITSWLTTLSLVSSW
jgi:hypothetical protein